MTTNTKPATPLPTGIHVSNYEPYNKRAAAGWNLDGARYHFWFKVDTKKVEDEIIYKNPFLDVQRHAPGHFETRKLDALAAKNAQIVKHVFEAIEDGSMIAVAISDYEFKERQRAEEEKAHRREQRIKEAGPRLFEELERLADSHARLERERGSVVGTLTANARALLRSLGEDA